MAHNSISFIIIWCYSLPFGTFHAILYNSETIVTIHYHLLTIRYHVLPFVTIAIFYHSLPLGTMHYQAVHFGTFWYDLVLFGTIKCHLVPSKSTAIYLRKYSHESFWKKTPLFAKFEKNKSFAIWKPDFLSKKMPSKLKQDT